MRRSERITTIWRPQFLVPEGTIQATTAAVQGLAGGNLSAATAGGAAPYLAEVVKTMTTDPVTGEVNKAANVAAHAVVNAALAVAQEITLLPVL